MEKTDSHSWLQALGLEQHGSKQNVILRYLHDNQISVAMFVFFVVMAIRSLVSRQRDAAKTGANRHYLEAPSFPEIDGLDKFDWKTEDPIKLRTFKPKYYLTMAIQNLDPSELLTMDRTYVERIKYRSRIIAESSDICIRVHDDARIRPAVIELYTYLLSHYLPKRFPQMFKLHYASFETGNQFMLENLVTKQVFATEPTNVTPTETLLKTLGMTVDEDFLFLLTEEGAESSDPKYVFQALVCICPSGWDPREKIGQSLASIHAPVPGYADKLESSMDRYFKNIEVGKYVKRSNWAITQHEELFMPDPNSNHAKQDEQVEAVTEIDPDKTFLRCERQTLHRLPKSKALVFAFKTYMDTMRDIKLEGLGDDLADAIDGLRTGNVPAMSHYKRSPVWGQAVKEYLRS
ncbi:hypothetical protein LTR64_004053 [Lithohypha guttulata]|uniref:uncharacterized protein n=1 Tax=Lithohypha guttulata TaxID=1690604 RepID=UPI002DE199B7|nr:hypothetical protein LTR51_006653 [Lithohypha guttulata]